MPNPERDSDPYPYDPQAAVSPDRRTRSEAAFNAEYDRLLKRALGLAIGRLGRLWGEDAVEMAAKALWDQCYAAGDIPEKPVEALFFRILLRRITDRERQEARRRGVEQQTSQLTDQEADSLADPIDLESSMEVASLVDFIDRTLENMDEKPRTLFRRVDIEKVKLALVAEELNMNPKTAESHLSKARQVMRELLQREGYVVPGRKGETKNARP